LSTTNPSAGVSATQDARTVRGVSHGWSRERPLAAAFEGLSLLRELGTLAFVKRLRAIITVLLVAVWLPASSHALLEYFDLIHQVHADHDADSTGSHEHDSDNHEAADGHCLLSSTHVSVPLPDALAVPVFVCPLDFWSSELHVELQPSGLAPPGTAPPQLSHRWQFSFRTALPARAPSLIS
jgi:hypothetical protein